MDMTGERRIPASRQTVWDGLNDPDVLKASIPGCKTLEKVTDTDLKATAAIKIGPISAQFTGKVQLLDLDPPNSYRIAGEGQGGVAGFANGGAKVHLVDDGAGTLLTYEVKAQVGGKIAQLGARLIDATAKQMADQFFDRFSARVSPAAPIPVAEPIVVPDATLAPLPAPGLATPQNPVVAPIHDIAAAEPAAISMFALLPKEPYGIPLLAWVTGAVYLVIFLMLFSGYVI